MYKLIVKTDVLGSSKTIQNVENNTLIPFDEANTDYQEYLKWLSEGNQPLPAEEV